MIGCKPIPKRQVATSSFFSHFLVFFFSFFLFVCNFSIFSIHFGISVELAARYVFAWISNWFCVYVFYLWLRFQGMKHFVQWNAIFLCLIWISDAQKQWNIFQIALLCKKNMLRANKVKKKMVDWISQKPQEWQRIISIWTEFNLFNHFWHSTLKMNWHFLFYFVFGNVNSFNFDSPRSFRSSDSWRSNESLHSRSRKTSIFSSANAGRWKKTKHISNINSIKILFTSKNENSLMSS